MNTSTRIEVKEISVKELKALMDSNSNVEVIDIREQFEYEIANIGAKLVPMDSILEYQHLIPRDKQVVIMCRSGRRSADVIYALNEIYGFTNLYNLTGGILAWSDEIDPGITKY